MPLGNIKKPDKVKELVDDINLQIRTGRLAPGDRILSIRELVKFYKVSQRIVLSALHILVSRSVLVKGGKGYSVSRKICSGEGVLSKGANPGNEKITDFSEYLTPVFFNSRPSLRIFISDYDSNISMLWDVVLKEYGRKNNVDISYSSCASNHIEDAWKKEHFDILNTTPHILDSIGYDKFVQFEDLAEIGIQEAELACILHEFVKSPYSHQCVIPFAVSLPFLFINRSLKAKFKEFREPRTYDDIFRLGELFEKKYANVDEYGFYPSGLYYNLVNSGALLWKSNGLPAIDWQKTEDFISFVDGLTLKGRNAINPDQLREFFDDRLLLLRNTSHLFTELNNRKEGGWDVIEKPLAPGAKQEVTLSCFAISSGAKYMSECISLVKYLCSREVQNLFASLHLNLPIYQELIDGTYVRNHHLPETLIGENLRKCTLLHPMTAAYYWFIMNIEACNRDFMAGKLTRSECIARLKHLLAETSYLPAVKAERLIA